MSKLMLAFAVLLILQEADAFTCDDGCLLEDELWVNDDWCDCADCSDESDWTCASCADGCPPLTQCSGLYSAQCDLGIGWSWSGDDSWSWDNWDDNWSGDNWATARDDWDDTAETVRGVGIAFIIIANGISLLRFVVFCYATYWCYKRNKQLIESGQGAECGCTTITCVLCCTVFACCFQVDPKNPAMAGGPAPLIIGQPVVVHGQPVSAPVPGVMVQAQVVQVQVVQPENNSPENNSPAA